MKLILNLLLSFSLCSLSATDHESSWVDRMRVKTLDNMDLLLHWGANKKQEPRPSPPIHDKELLTASFSELDTFAKDCGYFSPSRPIVGKVSSDPTDFTLVSSLLERFPGTKLSGPHLDIALTELLAKALAYRDLHLGQKIRIPVEINGTLALETFTVHHIFDIWQGMPAFGLVPEKDHLSSLLLFRGTDFSLVSKRGIASVMSDLDPAGPGLHAFRHAQKEIHDWLQNVKAQGKPSRVMGFSLGGALAAYTFIYENPLLSDAPSFSLCAPGVTASVVKVWDTLPTERKPLFLSYINAGDLIPQIGFLFGTVYCLSTDKTLKPLTAHTALMCTLAPLYRAHINTEKSGD